VKNIKDFPWVWVIVVGFSGYFLFIANGFSGWFSIPFDVALDMLIIQTVTFTLVILALLNVELRSYFFPIALASFYLSFAPLFEYLGHSFGRETLLSPFWAQMGFHIVIALVILMLGYGVVYWKSRRADN
tara:strand:- start:141 stop:530 length:390 start_codon:yes stop_codon:yes gene_type:complete